MWEQFFVLFFLYMGIIVPDVSAYVIAANFKKYQIHLTRNRVRWSAGAHNPFTESSEVHTEGAQKRAYEWENGHNGACILLQLSGYARSNEQCAFS